MSSIRPLLLGATLALGAACADRNGPPGPENLLTDPVEVAAIADSSVNRWYQAVTYLEPNLMLMVTADHATSNFCHGTRFNNFEPRIPFANDLGGADEIVGRRLWEKTYAALGPANDALYALDLGVQLPNDPIANERTRAAALWTQASSLMYLALVYDSAFVATAPEDPRREPRLRGHREVRDSALAIWDELIALTSGKGWAWDATVLPLDGGPPTAARINRIARTMAARTLVYSARTAAENAATDWARVLAYAEGGLTGGGLADMDFSVVGDNVRWYDHVKAYGAFHSWLRVDQRLIHRMASNIPETFDGLANQPVPVPEDDRLAVAALPCTVGDPLACTAGIDADYVYVGYVIGDPGRGVHMMSPFWHRRFVDVSYSVPTTTWVGLPLPHVLAAENDLIIAEALARTGGDLTRAAALVNKTHVGRGGRAPVGPANHSVLAGIEYERDVELLASTGMVGWWDRRRFDRLQEGTFRHLPVPATVLDRLGKPIYTYGGVGMPAM